MKRCSNCGAQNEDENLFCTECGKELPKGLVCPNCGSCMDVDDTFCSNCGNRIDEQSEPDIIQALQRRCSNCGTVLDEDDMFCCSCGKKVEENISGTQEVQQRKCINCEMLLEDDDVYCPNCGAKNDLESPLLSSNNNEISNDETDVENTQKDLMPVPVENENNSFSDIINKDGDNGDDNIIVEKSKTLNLKKLFAVVAGSILLAAIGYGCWCGLNTLFSNQQAANEDSASQESTYLKYILEPERFVKVFMEKVRLDSIDKARQDSIDMVKEKDFLENFYKTLDNISWEEEENYIRKLVTTKALQTLRDEYDYDCEEGDCLATWMFLYQGGTDCCEGMLKRDITWVEPSTYLVRITYKYGENDTCQYRVRIGLAKDGDSYKIDTIINVQEEENERYGNERINNSKLSNSTSGDTKQDFNAEAMKKAKEIQRIMVDINNVYNGFLRNGGTNREVGIYAMADISSKQQEGDMFFRELISLARKEGKQGMIDFLQQELEIFDEKAQGMKIVIRNNLNNL